MQDDGAAERTGASPPGRGDKKERILQAAIQVFAHKGFFNAKVSEIAKAAGVADGTIYLYFDNKDDLLIQVFEESMERIIRRLELALEGVSDPRERLRIFVEQHLAMVEEDPELAEVLTVELRQSAKFMKEYKNPKFGQYLRVISEIVDHGCAQGTFCPRMESWLVARALFGMLDEVATAWVLGKRFSLRERAEGIIQLFLSGICAPHEGPIEARREA
jgi:TetR/AcrR family fatty acid metabolism transcriptional regulator